MPQPFCPGRAWESLASAPLWVGLAGGSLASLDGPTPVPWRGWGRCLLRHLSLPLLPGQEGHRSPTGGPEGSQSQRHILPSHSIHVSFQMKNHFPPFNPSVAHI